MQLRLLNDHEAGQSRVRLFDPGNLHAVDTAALVPQQNPGQGVTAVDFGTKTDGAIGIGCEQGHVSPNFDVKALLAVLRWCRHAGLELCLQHRRQVARVLEDLTEDGLVRI